MAFFLHRLRRYRVQATILTNGRSPNSPAECTQLVGARCVEGGSGMNVGIEPSRPNAGLTRTQPSQLEAVRQTPAVGPSYVRSAWSPDTTQQQQYETRLPEAICACLSRLCPEWVRVRSPTRGKHRKPAFLGYAVNYA